MKTKYRISDVKGFAEKWMKAEQTLESNMLLPFCSVTEFEIYGHKLKHLNLRMMADLELCNNAVITGGESENIELDYLAILWRMSVNYKPCKKAHKRFLKKLKPNILPFLYSELATYLKEITEIPCNSVGGNKGTKKVSNKNKVSFYGYYVNTIASSYNWSLNEIMETPIAIIYQLINAHKESTDTEFKPSARHPELKKWGLHELRKLRGEI